MPYALLSYSFVTLLYCYCFLNKINGDGDGDGDDGTYRFLTDLVPFWVRYAHRTPKIKNFRPKVRPFDGEYLEKGKSHRYMSFRA